MKKLLICLAIFFSSISCHAGFLTGLATGMPDGSLSGLVGANEHRSQQVSYVGNKVSETEEEKKFRYFAIAMMFSTIPLTFVVIYLLNIFFSTKNE